MPHTHPLLSEIFKFYQARYPFEYFYHKLLSNIEIEPENYTNNKRFLQGFTHRPLPLHSPESAPGMVRIDLPVWFGHPSSAKRIMILGREPEVFRLYESPYVELVDNKYIFSVPFGLDRPVNYYQRAFRPFLERDDAFVYCTQLIKKRVLATDIWHKDRDFAADNFETNVQKGLHFLKTEIALVKPQIIICLGQKIFTIMRKTQLNPYLLQHVTCPSPTSAAQHIAKVGFQRIASSLFKEER